jgi:hypothetical protein
MEETRNEGYGRTAHGAKRAFGKLPMSAKCRSVRKLEPGRVAKAS